MGLDCPQASYVKSCFSSAPVSQPKHKIGAEKSDPVTHVLVKGIGLMKLVRTPQNTVLIAGTIQLFFLMFVAQQKQKDPKKEASSMCGRQDPIL